jgi:hypothetical protein
MSFYKNLELNDVALLQNTIPLLESMWGPHEQHGNGILVNTNPRDCTIWMHTRNIDSSWLNYTDPGTRIFIDVISKYVSEFNSNPRFGRAYIHRLKPGNIIGRHRDYNDQPYFSTIKRYQLFLDIPENVIIESSPMPTKNSVFWFNHNVEHYYENAGTENLIFCVFDVFD